MDILNTRYQLSITRLIDSFAHTKNIQLFKRIPK